VEVLVFGNVTLDVLCYPVNEVPRYESIAFDEVTVSPGGCGSNTAIGLAALGIPTGIVARTGDDDAADLLFRYWQRIGVDPSFVRRIPGTPTGTSIGLIDEKFQPRFIHTSGANRGMRAELIAPQAYAVQGVKFFHIAGFFVLPNLFRQVAVQLAQLQELEITTSLDVVFNVRMDDPELRASLWASMPYLDYFTSNDQEAARLTGENDFRAAAHVLRARGARNVIVKLGSQGCYVLGSAFNGIIPATKVNVIDTTGAGDAFAAGFIAGLAGGRTLSEACQAGNQAGAKICTRLGAIAAWLDKS
jgi:sugar/nucleoside kinase (ribokinase family)